MMATKRRRTTMRTASDLLLMDVTRAIILPLSLLLLILNDTILITTTPSLLLSTTSIPSSSSSFFIVQFAESFCNNLPSKLQPSRYLRHHHPNTSKIKTTTSTATNNKSVLFVDVVTDDGRRRNNVINISQVYINNSNDVLEISSPSSSSSSSTTLTTSSNNHATAIINRRDLFASATTACAAAMTMTVGLIQPVYAYTPDPDKLQESLYFISRVQEATVQQERFITNAYNQNIDQRSNSAKELQSKLKLTLLLVEKNYKLLDQINYCSQYIQPEDKLIDSSEAGYQAVDELQNAIDYVRNDNNWNNGNSSGDGGHGDVTEQQYTYLISSLKECRDQLFLFLLYIEPKEKLTIARLRVENENKQNRIEFGDANDLDDGNNNKNAGVYNPVLLPWK